MSGNGEIIYGCVAFRGKILSSHSSFPLGQLESQINTLVNTEKDNVDLMNKYDRYVLYLKSKDEVKVLIITDDQYPKNQFRITTEEIRKKFVERYSVTQMLNAYDNGMMEFNEELRQLIEKYNNPENYRFNQINKDIDDTQQQLNENIALLADRGMKLEDLDDQTVQLVENADNFKTQATKLKRAMWWKNIRLYLIGIAVLLIFVVIIVIIRSDFIEIFY